MMRRLPACLLALVLFLSPLFPGAARAEFPGETGDVQGWLDTPPDVSTGAEWYILALSQRGDYDFSACQSALLAALEATTSHTTRLKYALVLRATGSESPLIAETLAASAGQQGVMSHVYALHLMNNGVTAPGFSAAETVKTLLSLQMADGGWALRGAASDPDVTAMTLQCLAPHAQEDSVRAACERALERLSALQRADGSYASYGTPNPETTAQVLLALCELGIDPEADARFIKEGRTLLDGIALFRLEDGRYCHRLGDAANANATTQVYFAMTGYDLLRAGTPGLYLLETPAADGPASDEPAAPLTELAPTAALSWRMIAGLAIAAAAVLAALTLFLLKKRSWKNYAALLLLTAALMALIFTLDIQSAEDYYSGELLHKADAIGSVTLSIRCDAALGRPDAPDLPAEGLILPPTEIPLAPGDTVFTLLTEAARAFGIHMESSGGTGMRYVQGLAHLYEFGLGDLSGWLFLVNGETHSVGCDQYTPAPGDVIEWRYTLDLGGDIIP